MLTTDRGSSAAAAAAVAAVMRREITRDPGEQREQRRGSARYKLDAQQMDTRVRR
jgi:hypothetical protein